MLAINAILAASLGLPIPTTDVTFTTNHVTGPGQSVFVLGDRPELGGGDLRRAVKLVNTSGSSHTVSISLPLGADYEFEFVTRADAPGLWGNASNGASISAPVSQTAPGDVPEQAAVLFFSSFTEPVLSHAAQFQPFSSVAMTDIGPGRVAGERLFLAEGLGDPTVLQQFFIADDAGPGRAPASGVLGLAAPLVLVQDDNAFAYLPSPEPMSPPRKDYDPSHPPTVFSTVLNETRTYRVFLPRGYDTNTEKRYPVLYMNDGQNVFEQGAFGSWNVDENIPRFQALGLAREIIIVAVDHGVDRFRDYLPPFDGFRADDYADFLINELKPTIDASYRTLTDAANTGIAGSSLGGVVSMYLSYEFPTTFGRAGVFSPSVWAMPSFLNRIAFTPNPDLRVYLDSGDAGQSNDGFIGTITLRDTLAVNTTAPYAIESQLRHVVGFGQAHNETAWATRFPNAYAWMFPVSEEPNADLRALLPSSACSPADLTEPFGLTDLGDIDAFISAFAAAGAAADLAPPIGIVDLDDIDVFIEAFLAGCP
ncbi:MAG: alpha/beta hydrolase-fold protein [Planctomycetota bacterium]